MLTYLLSILSNAFLILFSWSGVVYLFWKTWHGMASTSESRGDLHQFAQITHYADTTKAQFLQDAFEHLRQWWTLGRVKKLWTTGFCVLPLPSIHQVLVGSCLPGKPLKLNVSQLGSKSPRQNMTHTKQAGKNGDFWRSSRFFPCVEVATSPKAFRNLLPVWCRSHFWHQKIHMIPTWIWVPKVTDPKNWWLESRSVKHDQICPFVWVSWVL